MSTTPESTPIKKLPPEVEALCLAIQNEFKTCTKKTNWIIGQSLTEILNELGNTKEIKEQMLHASQKAYKMDYENLAMCMRFYELYPDYRQVEARISMDYYAVLVTIPKGWERNSYEKKVYDQNLTVEQLKDLIKKDNDARTKRLGQNPCVIPVERIEPYIHHIKKLGNKVLVDLGFFLSKKITPEKMPVGDFVQIIQKDSYGENLILTEVDKVASPHYIYKAYVNKVLDGDELSLDLEAGLGSFMTREVRLRGVYSQPMQQCIFR